MKFHGITLQEGSTVANMTLASGTSFPSNPNEGELFFRSDSDTSVRGMYGYIGGNWDRLASADAITVPSAANFPSTANVGDLFYKDSNDVNEALYVFNGSSWVATGNSGGTSTVDGDLSGTISIGGTSTLTLDTIASAGTSGSASKTVTITIDAKGRVTSLTEQDVAIAASQVTSGTFADARIAQSNVTQHQSAINIAASQVTSGTFSNTRISQSNVTQHQAALTISETQITDGSLLARVSANESISGNWTFNGTVSGQTPTIGAHLVTKDYADALATGLDFKQSVKAATTTNITLSGSQTIDGVAISAGMRVLVKDQTNGTQNGIYVAASGAWARATDADNTPSNEVTAGMFCYVEEGTVNADSGWVLATNDPITLGSTNLVFTQFTGLGQVTAGNGLTKTGNTLNVVGNAGRIVVNADDIDLATVTDSGTGSFKKISVDSYGRVTGTANVVAGDIPDLSATYQPKNANLTSISGLSTSTTGLVKFTNGVASIDTSTYLTGNQSITVSGDATGSGTTAISLTLANSGVTAGTYNNSATAVTPLTIDAKGRITATGAAVTITPAFSSLTGKPTTLSGYGITDASPIAGSSSITTVGTIASGTWNGSVISPTYGGTGVNNGTRTLSINTNSGTLTFTNAATTLTIANTASISGTNTGDQTITLTGDVTGSGTGSFAATLANTGVTASTYNNSATAITPLTIDAKGRITATGAAVTITPAWASVTGKPTTVSGYGITDAVLKGGDTMTGALTLSGDPTANLHAATKQYVDAVASGLELKVSVKVATTANITLSGTQTIDGVAVVAGDRVLVKNQTTASQNGIYIVAAGAWARSTDADSNTEVTPGMFTFVEQGTVNADSGWVLTTDGAITLGTTSLTFVQFSGAGQIIAGTGISKSGNTLSLATSGVSPGTYTALTVDTYGRATTGANLTATGDATGTASSSSIALTLANSGVTAGTYNNSATAVTPITVDAKGRITATGTAVTITPAFSSLTGKPTTLSGYGITDAQPLDAELTAFAGLSTNGLVVKTAAGAATTRTLAVSGTGLSVTNADGVAGNPTITSNATNANTASTIVARDASGNFSAGTITAALTGNASTATTLQTARNIALTGDATGTASFNGSADASITASIPGIGNYRAAVYANANTTITTSDFGKFYQTNTGGPWTYTLPSASGQGGKQLTFWANSVNQLNLSVTGSGFYGPNASGSTTQVVPSGAIMQFVSDGSNWILTFLNPGSASTGRLIGVKYYFANTTYTPTPGTNAITVEMVGGGGGGGGAAATSAGYGAVGAGGGAGGYCRLYLTSGFSGATITVGAGGAGGAAGNNAGANGGATSFGGFGTANGGGGGFGMAAANGTFVVPGGGGGTTTVSGGLGITGNGGGFAQQNGPGQGFSGAGGSSYFGGAGWSAWELLSNSNAGNSASYGSGSGGSGGAVGNGAAGAAGGNGAGGQVVIYEYS